MTSKHRVFPIVLALLLIAVSCMTPLKVSAVTIVDDLDLVDYIDEIVVDGEDALVTYSIPIDPYTEFYGITPDNYTNLIGSGGLVNFSQDITTNTYQSFQTSVVLGTFEPVSNDANPYFKYEIPCAYTDELKNITHMMFDGVLYEVSVTAETDNYILINDRGDNYSFRGCYFYKGNHFSRPNTLQAWFNDNEEHTILFGTMVDVTEVVREYDSLYGNLWPLGRVDRSFRVIDVSDLRSGSSFEFSFTYDYLVQTLGTSGEFEPKFTAYFLDENLNSISRDFSNTVFIPELSDDRIHGTHTGTITVPEGAAFFWLSFGFSNIPVADCLIFQLLISNLEITCATSALDANSKSIEVVQNRIDDMHEDISNLKDQMQGVQDSVDDLNQGIKDSNEKLDDIISGGQAGDDLIESGDHLDQGNQNLDNVLGNLDHASGLLPDMPDNIQDVLGDNMDTLENNTLAALMPWNDEEYSEFWNAMFTPTLAAVSVALLLYFVFGKARSG